jgi:DNA-binding transcriptional regulator GbsR (MarR family)
MTAPALSTRLAQVESQFVDLWGTMSSLWGINPTMARIHGLLYITGEALTMDDMMDRLGISRGNVSMNLTKLVEWGLVQRAHQRGDRRDRYASVSDVWEMFTRVAAQRKRREIDPVLNTLRRCRDDLSAEALGKAAGRPAAKERYRRVDELLAFLQLMDHLATQFLASHKSLKAAVEMLAGKD